MYKIANKFKSKPDMKNSKSTKKVQKLIYHLNKKIEKNHYFFLKKTPFFKKL